MDTQLRDELLAEADAYLRADLLRMAYRSLYALHFGLYEGSKLDAFKQWRKDHTALCEEDTDMRWKEESE